MRPWILAETNYTYTKENRYEVAVLPLGATEPHNLHLPYSMDTREGDLIGEIPEGALGARVHASIDGTVESVEENIVIKQ